MTRYIIIFVFIFETLELEIRNLINAKKKKNFSWLRARMDVARCIICLNGVNRISVIHYCAISLSWQTSQSCYQHKSAADIT